MNKFNFNDFNSIEKYPKSPAWMKGKIQEILFSSTTSNWKVESCNPTTGEYRLVLTGTLDCFDENYNGGTQG